MRKQVMITMIICVQECIRIIYNYCYIQACSVITSRLNCSGLVTWSLSLPNSIYFTFLQEAYQPIYARCQWAVVTACALASDNDDDDDVEAYLLYSCW